MILLFIFGGYYGLGKTARANINFLNSALHMAAVPHRPTDAIICTPEEIYLSLPMNTRAGDYANRSLYLINTMTQISVEMQKALAERRIPWRYGINGLPYDLPNHMYPLLLQRLNSDASAKEILQFFKKYHEADADSIMQQLTLARAYQLHTIDQIRQELKVQ